MAAAMRMPRFVQGLALVALLVGGVWPVVADHPQTYGAVTTTFDHRGGNEWWVEVRVDGGDIYVVHAIESDGNSMALQLNNWGNYVGSMHIEPGHTIRFAANARDGSPARESCWFTHPGGAENCAGVTDDRLAAATYVSMANGGFERTTDVAIDAAGNAYVAGSTGPGEWEHHDALIAKYNPDGSRAWRRVIEGNGANLAYSIDFDAAGNIYVGGVTESTDFPATGWQTTNHGRLDGWVAKLSSTGTIQWATLIGGSQNDHVHAIGVDSSGAVTAAGFTNSCDFPTYGPAFQTASSGCTFVVDGFVTRLTPDGSSAVHSTFYGGLGLGTDIIEDLVSEPDGTVHIVGRTDSADLPMTADAAQTVHGGHTDAFYARFSPLSQLEYATFLGGNQDDRLRGVVLDGTGGAVVSGDSGSLEYPTTAGSVQPQHSGGAQCIRVLGSGPNPATEAIPCQDIVVTRINEAGDIAYSTFFGTQRDEEGYGIARDAAGGLHVTGRIYDEGALPAEQDPIGPAGGYSDAFLVSIAADGASATRSVRIGGTHGDFGEQTAIAPDGSLWLVGWTWSPDIPTTPGSAQRSLDGMEDGYLARLSPPATPPPISGFDATFTLVTGNAYWVQSQITPSSGFTVATVDVRLNDGAWKPLKLQSWGVRAWAASYPIPEGTVVQMRATATTGASDLSECYRWIPPQSNGQNAATVACGSTPPPPPPPPTPTIWEAKPMGYAGVYSYGGDMAVGDADRDGANEVYSATETGLFQFKWTGSSWASQRLGSLSQMTALAVGDGNGDGLAEVYVMTNGAFTTSNLVRYTWGNNGWSEDTLLTLPGGARDMTIANIDGRPGSEIYVGLDDGTNAGIQRLFFNSLWWENQVIASMPGHLLSLWVADGDRDGTSELYVGHGTTSNSDEGQSGIASTSRLRLVGEAWEFLTIDQVISGAGMQFVVAGDGDRDGKAEVYSITSAGQFRSVTYSPSTGWSAKPLMDFSGDGASGLFLGDGDGDGSQELYVPTSRGQLFQVRWSGATWDRNHVASPRDGNDKAGDIARVVVGDGDNDGIREAYFGVSYSGGFPDPGHIQVYEVAPLRGSGFGATFTMVQGNVWWQQAQVTPSGEALSKVDVSLNGGAWQPLKLQTWGVREYAGSYHAVQGTSVQLRATSTTGATALSSCYQWIPASGQDASQIACGSTPPPPPPPSGFDATFTGVKGNDWWVQANVAANQPLDGVDVRVNCAPSWKPLTKQSWGGWTASFNIPAGSKVDFAARSTSGAADASGGYTWPQATATSGCAFGVWPQQGSFVTYNIHHAMGGGGETFVTDARLNLAYNNGAWTGICTGRSTNFGNDGETSTDWTATVNGRPPLKLPAATSVGATHNLAYFFPSYDGHTCDLRTSSDFPATVQRQEDRVTNMPDSNGAPITLRAWVSDDPAEGRYAAAWDTKLGLVLDWNRYGPGGYGGDLVATDAPVR